MQQTSKIILSTVYLCVTILILPLMALARDMAGWSIAGDGAEILDGQAYSLFNSDQKLYLEEKDRPGANLGWTKAPNNFIEFKRQSGTGPIKCEEPLAISVEKEWLIWGKQSIGTGINLTTRKELEPDHYQWVLKCQQGTSVPINKTVVLENTKVKDSVVGCKRTWGVNLCWTDDVWTIFGKNYRKADIPKSVRKEMRRVGGTVACAAMGAGPAAQACGEYAAGKQ